jgi:glucosamine-6-phosphate deaminase
MPITLLTTLKGSMLEGFFPKGWDLAKMDQCASQPAEKVCDRQSWWHDRFEPVPCANIDEFDVKMGHEIAGEIAQTARDGRPCILILPVGPMGMYMDESADKDGNSTPGTEPGSFEDAMLKAFYGPLGKAGPGASQRHFAAKESLPAYAEQIAALRKQDGKLTTVFGIGRAMHIAFWEPHFAAEFDNLNDWKAQTHRIGARLHPLTIEQNAITSFKSRTTLVPCYANTIGPGLFLQSDRIIGGCDGALGRGMMWQGLSLWCTLRYGPDPWVPSSFMPTLPGRLFFLRELAGPLEPECN